MTTFTRIVNRLSVCTRALLAIGLALSVTSSIVIAQQDIANPERGVTKGASFAISDIETINTTNGNLMLRIPLVSLPQGRGSVGASIGLMYNSKLYDTIVNETADHSNQLSLQNFMAPGATGGWKYTGSNGYHLRLTNRWAYHAAPSSCGVEAVHAWKLEMEMPDGSLKEFRPVGKTDWGAQGYFNVTPAGFEYHPCPTNPTVYSNSGMTYYSTDGSYIKLIVDYVANPTGNGATNPWTMYMPDGSKVTGATSSPTRVYDKNGNYIEGATDSFGRLLSLQANVNTNEDHVSMTGVDGEELVWKVFWRDIEVDKDYETTGYSGGMERGGTSDQNFIGSFRVVDRIVLPDQLDNLEYEFEYNTDGTGTGWGEISKITLPSGAVAEYEFATPQQQENTDKLLQRYPSQKTLSYWSEYDGSSTPITETWTYAIGSQSSTITNPDGSYVTEYHGDTSYSHKNRGLVYKTLSSNGTLNHKIWQHQSEPFTHSNVALNSFVKTEFTTVPDISGNPYFTKIVDYEHDLNGNVTGVFEYDWVAYSLVPKDGQNNPSGIPQQASLKRITINEYYNSVFSSMSNGYWQTGSPNVRSAMKSTEIRDGNNTPVSRTEFTYDNASTTANLIETKSWDSYKGGQARAYSNPLTSTNSISSTTTYNSYGMPLTTTDAKGTVTAITYGSISTPNGTVTDLYPTQTVAAYGTGLARTSAVTYDFFTGAVLTTTDVDNNITNAVQYDDLGRPVKSISAQGTALESWTTSEYYDEDRFVVVRSDLEVKGDGKKVAVQHFDQLGRERLSRTIENIFSESPYNEQHGIKVQTRYKAGGVCTFDSGAGCSAQLSSNPYRAATSGAATGEETMGWTVSQSRNDGRYSEIETFAGAALPPAFGGSNTNSSGVVESLTDANATTVTDQAGKQRRSITNALGQLIRVDEPTAAGLGTVASPNQPTYYYYNTLGNMVRVNQGVQNRYFMHDSLGRLLRVRQPEQEVNTNLNTSGNPDNNSWTIGFTYDDNSNLLTSRDANNVVITSTYDALNRPLTRSYSDGTPTVTNYYDGGGLPSVPNYSKGQLTRVSSSVSDSRYTEFDIVGRLKQYQQITDGVTYTSKYAYNLSGALVEEEYPSGRVVKNVLDATGNFSLVQSKKDTAAGFWNYAQHFTYNAAGAVTKVQLGNGLWETAQLNSRLQSTQLGLGTVATGANLWKVDYEFGELQTNGTVDASKNSGNIAQQTLTVPGTSFVQSYEYDSLQRLTTAVEKTGSTTNWSQDFDYDRYGNRIGIDQTIGSLTMNVTPSVDAATNRFSGSQGFGYDNNGNIVDDIDVVSSLPREFLFNGDNKQTEVKQNGVTIGRYYYDGEGRRVKKVTDTETTVFVHSGGKLIAEYSTATSQTPSVSYTTTDHLGSPRVITNELGQVSSRRDFMPFGEELYVGVGNRTGDTGLKYSSSQDDVRQKFTGYQKDDETNLDFAEARMYQNLHGRFTAVDPLLASGKSANPQTFNRYVYVMNRPSRYIDPSGLVAVDDHFINRDGSVIIVENDCKCHSYYIETDKGSGDYRKITTLQENAAGLVEFPAEMNFFGRYGVIDSGGGDHGPGDHFLKPEVAAALFGVSAVLKDEHGITMSYGDMSSSNGRDPWQPGFDHHKGHGHNDRSGLDVDFRYINDKGESFQSKTARSDSQFSVSMNQAVFDTASTFGFTANFQGNTQGRKTGLTGPKAVGGHNDHGHLGYEAKSARITKAQGVSLWNGVFRPVF